MFKKDAFLTTFRRSWILDGTIALAIALISFWLYPPSSWVAQYNSYDLGIAVYGAVRASDGFIPYVDMHTPYGPAQYYIDALVFKVFGTNMRVYVVESYVVRAVSVGIGYCALRGCVSRGPALLLTFITIMAFPLSLVYVAMLVAAGCMVRYSYRQHAGWLIATGAAIGFVGALRWDFGVYCGLVFTVALLSLPYIGRVVAASDYDTR